MYVKRVFAGGRPGGPHATWASAQFGMGVTSEVVQDAGAADNTVRLKHLFGIQNGTGVTIIVGGRALAPAAPFKRFAKLECCPESV